MTPWEPLSVEDLPSVSLSIAGNTSFVKTIEELRRVPRLDAGWFGKWRLLDDPDRGSFECTVLDLSTLGLGIETSAQSCPFDLTGKKVAVTAQPLTGGSITIRFVGTVRHMRRAVAKTAFRAGRQQGPMIRLGIEFVSPSKVEVELLEVLSQLLGGTSGRR